MRQSETLLLALEAGSEGHRYNCETFGNEGPERMADYFHRMRNEIRHNRKRFATMVGHTSGGSQHAIQCTWQMGGETAKATNFQRLA
jgi:hypothetical protein